MQCRWTCFTRIAIAAASAFAFALIFYADCRGEFITTSPHTMGTPSFDIPRGYAAEARSLRQNKKKANISKNKANISIANAKEQAAQTGNSSNEIDSKLARSAKLAGVRCSNVSSPSKSNYVRAELGEGEAGGLAAAVVHGLVWPIAGAGL